MAQFLRRLTVAIATAAVLTACSASSGGRAANVPTRHAERVTQTRVHSRRTSSPRVDRRSLGRTVQRRALGLRKPALTHMAQTFTFLGSKPVVGSLAMVVLLLLLTQRQFTRATTFAFAMAGSAFLTVAMKVLVASSRVYLGYHWFTDVLASGLVAVVWLSIV